MTSLFYVVCFVSIIHHAISQCIYDPQYHDSWLFCKMFQNSSMDTNIYWWNSTEPNYCEWVADYPNITDNFECHSNGVNITKLNLDIGDYCVEPFSIINTEYGLPSLLYEFDIDQPLSCNGGFGGYWSLFNNLFYLQDLITFDIEDHSFNSYLMDDLHWNIILVWLPALKTFDIGSNRFNHSFTGISLLATSNITTLLLDSNRFTGIISINNFLNKLPNLRRLRLDHNQIEQYFDNLDFMTTMPNLVEIQIDDNLFNGSISLSSGLSLPHTLEIFDLEENHFSSINWSIFENLTRLISLEIGDNEELSGLYIDWDIIADLSQQSLEEFSADEINWNGYADFTGLSENITIVVDQDYLCDPTIYICPLGTIMVNRIRGICVGRSDCESTCRCSDNSIPLTRGPTSVPTETPIVSPTAIITDDPSNHPTVSPTGEPTDVPLQTPTGPSNNPSTSPSSDPTETPTSNPTKQPTKYPTADPTIDPTWMPTWTPTWDPTKRLTQRNKWSSKKNKKKKKKKSSKNPQKSWKKSWT